MGEEKKLKELEQEIEAILLRAGYELVDLQIGQYGGRVNIRVFIDRVLDERPDVWTKGGIKLADCEKANHLLSAWLDEKNFLDVPYNLEVSSPGIDRVLKKPSDYIRFRERFCRVKTLEPVIFKKAGEEIAQKNFRGKINDFHEDTLFLKIENGDIIAIPHSKIEKTKLEIEI